LAICDVDRPFTFGSVCGREKLEFGCMGGAELNRHFGVLCHTVERYRCCTIFDGI
jgi:hypothetical protein